jgi:lipooligosaccharide transport system ATP-binding protein
MDHGLIVAEGSPVELIARYSTREVVELRFEPGRQLAAEATAAALVPRLEVLPDRLLLYTPHGDATLEAVAEAGITPLSTLVRRSTLEDVFLHLTGRSLVD